MIGVLVRDGALTEDVRLPRRTRTAITKMREEMGAGLDASARSSRAGGRAESVAKFGQLTEARKAYNGQLDLVVQQLRAGDFNSARAGLIVTLPAAQAAYFDNLDAVCLDGPEVGRRRRGRGLRPICLCPQPADRPGGRRRRDRRAAVAWPSPAR